MKKKRLGYIKYTAGFFLVILSITLLPAFTIAPVAPEWTPLALKNWAFDMRLYIGRPVLTSLSLTRALKGETKFEFITDYEEIQLRSDDLTLSAALYGMTTLNKKKPCILLVHGSTPQGNNLGIYRLLGKELASLGYIVLSIDLRGYGKSDDPKNVNDALDFEFTHDIDNSISYLTHLPQVDQNQIYVIGHSFGADTVISSVKNDTRVKKIILIGPGRRFLARSGDSERAEFDYFKRRDMRYMDLSNSIPDEVFIKYRMKLPLENHMEFLSDSSHMPIMLIDGELESVEDRNFLKKVYESMAGNKAYVTLSDADHYANIANFGNLIIYDNKTAQQLLHEVHSFLQQRDN